MMEQEVDVESGDGYLPDTSDTEREDLLPYTMATPGIELLTRNGFQSVQNDRRASADPRKESLSSQTTDERNWSWKYLRDQFELKNMEDLYELYQQRLHRGYFSVFLLLQLLLCLTHVIVLLIPTDEIRDILPDIITYAVVMILCFLLVIITFQENMVKRYQWIPLITSCIVIVLLVLSDIGLPLYHNTTKKSPGIYRPAYGVHTLLACYIFLPIIQNLQALVLGITVTLCHVVALGMNVYINDDHKYQRLASDFMYLLSVNCLGLYFRYMNEVFIRRTFLDRRACVEATFKLECEKRQEDHLLFSILPQHIVEDVKKDIRSIFQYMNSKPSVPFQRKPFSEMYVKVHHNVTILYADVVNYSQLTVSLPPTKLVETLNELFGKFDEASEERNVLRIKFLGDCYYCVAGVPQSNPHHAKSCVDLGLDMIAIIKDVRESCNLRHGLDMRIGIHSGSILSGLVGVSKWQYDIWSRDVIIANHMEQTGQPGKVHITKQTLDLLENKYHYKPADGASRSTLLQKNKIETFFIIPAYEGLSEDAANGVPHTSRRQSVGVRRLAANKTNRRVSPEVMAISRRRTKFMDNTLHQYQEAFKKAEYHMERVIQEMHLGIYDRWACRENINPVCLTFEDLSWELPFTQQPDPLFKYYIACALGVLIFMFLIQGIGVPSYHWRAWTGFGVALAILLLCIPLTWTHFLWNKFWDPHDDEDDTPEPENCILKFLYDLSFNVSSNVFFRTCMYLVVSAVLSVTTLLELVDCRFNKDTPHECLASWHITQTCSLVVLMNFFFLRIHFQLKLIMSLLIMGACAYGIWSICPQLFKADETWNPGLLPQVAHMMSLVFLSLSLHLMDRQSEYMSRLDYRWKRRLAAEQEEAETTRSVNKMLLQNILPMHVAEIYLNPGRIQDGLYHEEYENVAVMFASLVEFAPDEIDGHESNEMGSLKLLNRIICDFDKILFEKNILGRVEKIKMAGWTYMAASGLDPGRRDSLNSNPEEQTSEHIVPVLVRFAAKMMHTLQNINQEKHQTFKLRVGISHGSVTAGVVGAQKPLYDIWGDAVNMASRMDSTGESGRIQVTEETANILEQQGILCQYRGPTYVKNKSYVTTYFVCLDENFEIIKSASSDIEDELVGEQNFL